LEAEAFAALKAGEQRFPEVSAISGQELETFRHEQ
jgi:hypothetical protein